MNNNINKKLCRMWDFFYGSFLVIYGHSRICMPKFAIHVLSAMTFVCPYSGLGVAAGGNLL